MNRDDIHKEIMEDALNDLEEQEKWYSGPIKYIVMLFLLLIIVLWGYAYYGGSLDPEPRSIPSLDDVLPQYNLSVVDHSSSEIVDYLDPMDPVTKHVATRIAGESCDSARVCQAKALFYFVRDNFGYVAEQDEYIQTTPEFLKARAGDCDDHALTLANLLRADGFQTRFVHVPNHVYVKVWLPEASSKYKQDTDWVSLDPTCKSCDFGEINLKYLLS